MINRVLYVRKYHSGRLKEFDYEIDDDFETSKALHEVIGLSDNQMLRTIREVTHRTIDMNKVERLFALRSHYKHSVTYQQSKRGKDKAAKIRAKLKTIGIRNEYINHLYDKYVRMDTYVKEWQRVQDKIDRTLFCPDYVTVVMDTPKQYEYLYRNGFLLNGVRYKRLSCSAGQARVSTVIFCNENIIPRVTEILNNGRDTSKKISPSKFNAYFGLAGSATKIVSEPKFIVVKDYENTTSFKADYVIENGYNVDDTVIEREMTDVPMNRTDGMGLITYRQAKKWADELGLDYVPSQFCIRQNFIKGMLCVFPIHEFCEEINGGNYIVDTIYKDENGEYIKADLRDYDVIISESQFKLWDSFPNIETYIENCHKNKLYWGVTLVAPKEAKHMLKLNYQFIQTLKLSQHDVEKLASQFVDWITGVSYDNPYYMMLFLLGVNNSQKKINNFLSSSDQYWIKAFIANPDVKNDKYIRTKIRSLIKKRIEDACKGDIYVNGNFQVLVSDPYGYMQHVCGLPVTGLLKEGEFYSNYWNNLGVDTVDSMRSPLTYFSEHVVLSLRNDEETNKWYRYCDLGIILNYHGHEVCNYAGADFDMDILATTSNEIMIKGVYENECPVVYDAPKPKKINFTDYDLYEADTFSFGSIIGPITNKSSNAHAILPEIAEKYGEHSPEYRLVKSRLQQCCKAQSAQIDKAKIGRAVKGIPKFWTHYNKIRTDKNGKVIDRRAQRKVFYNKTLIDKRPYFFQYVYKDTKRKYKDYLDRYNTTCQQRYKMTFRELEQLPRKTQEQAEFIDRFYQYSPVVHSNSSMNMLCKHIEGINFDISGKIKATTDEGIYALYKSDDEYKDYYSQIAVIIKDFMRNKSVTYDTPADTDEYTIQEYYDLESDMEILYKRLSNVCANPRIVTNCLVDYFYKERPSSNKDILWKLFGKVIYDNIKKRVNVKAALFPIPDKLGDIEYLGYRYGLEEVIL